MPHRYRSISVSVIFFISLCLLAPVAGFTQETAPGLPIHLTEEELTRLHEIGLGHIATAPPAACKKSLRLTSFFWHFSLIGRLLIGLAARPVSPARHVKPPRSKSENDFDNLTSTGCPLQSAGNCAEP